ncbi:hypothetical protein COO91_07796 [Nostoc flagelliforme CCNUN1]|uniref:Uncharacterized protein n=1 Tax=Nostoc flagelliforme CCNUN1 TaxID=2038116 RepID=A0A2K8T208_9NOSO|nr:hypothetical protein COO91_07796 [Nostoc flagelliforme CCNUN1]
MQRIKNSKPKTGIFSYFLNSNSQIVYQIIKKDYQSDG